MLSTALLALLVPLAGQLEHLDNLAVNGSFESDNDRDQSPDGWRGSAYDSPAKLSWDGEVARSGKRSLRISDSFFDGDQRDWKKSSGRWTSLPRPIEPGSKYTLSVWVKTRGVTGQAYAHMAWLKDGRWLSEDTTERLSGTGDWQQVTVSASAPADADSVALSMNLARSKGTAWFDDVVVSGKGEMPEQIDFVFNETDDWYPFEFPLDDTNLDSINLTSFLDAPAGKQGFVSVGDDGHLYFASGQRARFFGTNVGGAACTPDKESAEVVAARLAKYGVNMLRLHAMDARYGGLIDYDTGTSQEFDPEALDRLDYFTAELKERGIYVYMDLLDYRMFRTADGVTEGDRFTHNWDGSMKGASIFDPRMIELQKEYATKLLTHRNPYTELRYVDDPAIAIVEITNENSIFYFFRNSELSRPYYRDALARHWNRWLVDRYGDRASLAKAWTDGSGRCCLTDDEDATSGSVRLPFGKHGRIPTTTDKRSDDPMLAAGRISDLLRFLAELQREYYGQMRGHLRKIGVRVPIAGTNQTFTVIDTLVEAEGNDLISRNQYWRHPHRKAKPYFKFANEPMLRVDLSRERNPLSVIARTSVVGKPQAVTEFNFPWPNEYRVEGLLMSTAYACLQDWDVFLLFSYDLGDKQLSMFRSQSDPARWGTFPAAAAMFHRADVSPGRNEVHVIHTLHDAVAPRPDTSHARHTSQRFLTFLSKVRTGFVKDLYRETADVVLASGGSADAKVAQGTPVIRIREQPYEHWLYGEFVEAAKQLDLAGYEPMRGSENRFDADTGELSLDYDRGLLTIDTKRTQAAIGFLADSGQQRLADLAVRCRTEFAAVCATSLDDRSLGDSRRVLITAVGRAENTAQGFVPPTPQQRKWTATAWMLPAEGRSPVITEPIHAELQLKVPDDARAYTLDATGRRLDQLPCVNDSGRVRLRLDDARSIWCEVVVP